MAGVRVLTSHAPSPIAPGWPEWHDTEVAAERWDPPALKVEPRRKDTEAASPITVIPGPPPLYEDPDGRVFIPPPLRAVQWKRPLELNLGRLLVIRDNIYDPDFDLITGNGHLFESELMRSIISQIVSMSFISTRNPFMPDPVPGFFTPCESLSWKPWHHVYSNCKTGHIAHNPITNFYGKYVIRIYYMGHWRKVYVDDLIPLNAQGQLLLPCNSQLRHELWPMLLTKALLKVASLECCFTGFHHYKLTEFMVIDCLTGWIAEQFEIQAKDNPTEVWTMLLSVLRKYRNPTKSRSSSPGDNESEDTIGRKTTHGKISRVLRKLESSRNASPTDIASTPDDPWDEYGFNPATNMAVMAEQREITNHMSDQRKKEIVGIIEDFGLDPTRKCPVLVLEARMSPVEPLAAPAGTPRWKLIRRHLWDKEVIKLRGVDLDEDPIRSVGLVLPWNAVRNPRTAATSEESILALSDLGIKEESEYGFQKPFPTLRVDWINHWRFCKCFGRVIVFHRPHGYRFTERLQDSRGHGSTGHTSPARRATRVGSPTFSWFTSGLPFYLFVDSTRDTKVLLALALGGVVCFGDKTTSDNTSERSAGRSPVSSSSRQSTTSTFAGSITVEPFYWRLQSAGRTLCNLKAVMMKSAFLLLPPGRHVLRVIVKTSSPGLLTVCSNHHIILSEEEALLNKVASDPARLVEAGKMIALELLDCFQTFSEPILFRPAQNRLYKNVCPRLDATNISAYLEAFNEVFSIIFAKLMDKVTTDVIFAARAFTLDLTMPFSAKQVGYHGYCLIGQRKSQKKSSPPLTQGSEPSTPYTLMDDFVHRYREAGSRYLKAAIIIQKYVRRYLARKVVDAQTPYSRSNVRASDQFLKAAAVLEKNIEDHGSTLLTTLFLLYPACLFDFPFWTDELNHVTYHDYTGVVPIIQANSWFAVYRDVFHVNDIIPLVTTFTSDLPSCSVHIVNNDTALAVPQVFLKPDYYEYLPNKHGYTVLVEGCVREMQANPCKWKLRLISPAGSSFTPMPKDSGIILLTKEIKEYYMPQKEGILIRVAITTSVDTVTTIQCGLSASDVNVSLTIYDGTETIRSATGRGHSLLAAVMLHPQYRMDVQSDSPSGAGSTVLTAAPKKYIVEARIEKDSWLVHMSHVPFIQRLMLKERAENIGEPDKTDKVVGVVTDKKKKKEKQVVLESKVDVKIVTDLARPHWILRIVLDNASVEYVDIRKDTSRADEIAAVKRKWDPDDSGRSIEAERLRAAFLQTHTDMDDLSTTYITGDLSPVHRSEVSPPFSPHKASVSGTAAKGRQRNTDQELIEAQQMVAPQPLPTKIRLKPFDASAYYHYRPFGPRIKDPKLVQAQTIAKEQRQKEYESMREMFANVCKKQNEQRLQEKLLLADQAESCQARLEALRLKAQESRERIRTQRLEEEAHHRMRLMAAVEEARLLVETDPKKRSAANTPRKK